MEQRICDICKKNLADMSFKVKRSNKRWGGLWSDYEDIDLCNKCGSKLLGVVNLTDRPSVQPPPLDWTPPSDYVPRPSYTPPTPPSSGSSVQKKE